MKSVFIAFDVKEKKVIWETDIGAPWGGCIILGDIALQPLKFGKMQLIDLKTKEAIIGEIDVSSNADI
jgi:hypothetical protein